MSEHLTVWTVYRNPADYPGMWVLRGFDIGAGPTGMQRREECAVADSLEMIRAQIPPGLARLDRHPNDDPVIYESWV